MRARLDQDDCRFSSYACFYYQTSDETFRKMAKSWGKLFLINFAIGVVTGIVQEFQFGMNWSEYSRYMGDIFAAPLAIEALLALNPLFWESGSSAKGVFRRKSIWLRFGLWLPDRIFPRYGCCLSPNAGR